MKRNSFYWIWQEVYWTRPFSQNDVIELLTHLAVLSPRKQIVWEIRGTGGKVRFFVGTHRRYVKPLKSAFLAHGKIVFSALTGTERTEITKAKNIKRTKPVLSLGTARTLSVLKTALSALAETRENETLALQIILGDSIAPTPAPDKAANPHATILDTICGNVGTATKESLTSIKDKKSQHGFYSCIRIGATAETEKRRNGLLLSLMSALRQFETAGVKLICSDIDPELLNNAKIPFLLPLRLSIAELSGFVLLPCTNTVLSGIDGLHPKLVQPPKWLKNNNDRCFAKSLCANPINLNIPIKDALEHTVILGATGSGKSTVMLNMILADIQAGRGVLVVDPKADLVNDLLSRIPQERTKDVVVVDPSDVAPVGINPFVFNKQAAPSLISDTILSVLGQIFKDSWGVYTQDVLSAALFTLANAENATLLQLIPLLSDEHFRKAITKNIKDAGLRQFWANYEAMSQPEQRKITAPVMNKLRQFTMRPTLRNMLGQVKPKFTLSDLFDNNKIVLVPLNKGLIGADSAKLLGSLIVGLTWTLALSRAKIPAEKRQPVSIFIDELQDYLALPTDFSDALAQARGLGVGFTVAHQYRSQLTPAIKAAIDTNARNKVIFGLNAADAKDMASMSTDLETADFLSLPRYHIYARLQNDGKSTGWISGQTLSAPPTLRSPYKLKDLSMAFYGQALSEIEPAPKSKPPITPIGRKKITG